VSGDLTVRDALDAEHTIRRDAPSALPVRYGRDPDAKLSRKLSLRTAGGFDFFEHEASDMTVGERLYTLSWISQVDTRIPI
jgi:hypothetical protein